MNVLGESDSMLIVNGHSFRCSCGANVFHRGEKDGMWICNGCHAEYTDDTYKNTVTNFEKMRSLKDEEEVADFVEYGQTRSCDLCDMHAAECHGAGCRRAFIEWLRMPADNED